MGTVVVPPGEEAGGSYVAVYGRRLSAEPGMQKSTQYMLAMTVGHDTHYTGVWDVIKNLKVISYLTVGDCPDQCHPTEV